MAYLLVNDSYEQNYKDLFEGMDFENIILSHISESAEFNKLQLGEMIVVLPTSKLMKYTRSRIISHVAITTEKPTENLRVFSLLKLIRHITQNLLDLQIISDATALTLFEDAVNQTELKFYRSNSNGYTISSFMQKKLFAIVSGLRKEGLTPENILSSLNNSTEPGTNLKCDDLIAIMKKYEELLGESMCDEAGILMRLNKFFTDSATIEKSIAELFPGTKLILLNNFSNFTTAEYEFLQKLSQTSLSLAIQIDFNDSEGPLLSGFETTILKLANNGLHILDSELKGESNNEHVNFLRKNLFSNRLENRTSLFDNIIRIVKFSNRIEEVKAIGCLIKKLNTKDKIKLSDICICYRQPGQYAELFREIFNQYKIPVNITDRFSLSGSTLINSFMSVINTGINNFKFKDVVNLLSSEYTCNVFKTDTKFSMNDFFAITNQLDNPDMYGLNGWLHKLTSLLFHKQRLVKNEKNESYKIKYLNSEIKKTSDLISIFEKIGDVLNFPSKVTADEFDKIIKHSVLRFFNFYNTVWEKYQKLEKISHEQHFSSGELILQFEVLERESRAYYALLQLLQEFVQIRKTEFGNTPIPFATLVEKFFLAIEGKKYQIREKSDYGVTITSIEQTRGIPFKVSILCGMLSNEFPLRYNSQAMFGVDMPEAEEKHYISERLLYYFFLTNNPKALADGTKRIFITYPTHDSNKELQRSSYIDYLLNITNLEPDATDSNDSFLSELSHTFTSMSDFMQYKYFNPEYLDSDISAQIKDTKDFLSEPDSSIIDYEFNEEANRSFSPSRINSFTDCPMKYFFRNILSPKVLKSNKGGLDSMTLGTVMHEIFHQFYDRLIAENDKDEISYINDKLPLVQLLPQNREKYLELLKEIAGEIMNEDANFNSVYYAIDKIRIIGTKESKGLLEYWLNFELEKSKNWKYLPSLFEKDFFSTLSSPEIPEVQPIKTNGFIDRIELDYNEQNNEIRVLVADYKGSLNSKAMLNNGKVVDFQLPIYLNAVSDIIKEYVSKDVKITPVSAVYYGYNINSTKESKKNNLPFEKQLKITIPTPESSKREAKYFDEIRTLAVTAGAELIDTIKHGNFSCEKCKSTIQTPCDYTEICNIFQKK